MKRPGHAARFGKVGFLDVRSWTKDVFPGLRRPGGPGDTISFQLPSTGDYVVEVLPGMGEGDAYSITVTIPAVPQPSNSSLRRVKFAPGTDHASISGSVSDDQSDRYVLQAAAGQTMTLAPVSPLRAVVTAPNGTQLPGGPDVSISFELPVTGDYVIEILPGMGEQTDYSITITIPG